MQDDILWNILSKSPLTQLFIKIKTNVESFHTLPPLLTCSHNSFVNTTPQSFL